MSSSRIKIAICLGFVLSFVYGAATVRYKIFPYEQLRIFKRIFISDSDARPSLTYSNYFYNKISVFEQHGRDNYDVVFIGDSITDSIDWEDLFPTIKIANRGIGGDRTDGVLKRLESIYSTSADSAFIMIGINDFDIGVDADEVFENYQKIVGGLSNSGMKVYIQSTILAGKKLAYLNENIIDLNEKLQNYSMKNKSVTYIDLNGSLTAGAVLNSKFTIDDVHLNGQGYAVWKKILDPYMQNIKIAD